MKILMLISVSILLLQGCFHADDNNTSDENLITTASYTLNDTGANSYLVETINDDESSSFSFTDTAPSDIPGQDASNGRDISNNNNSDGSGGFSFTKLDGSGTALASQGDAYATTPWSCVYDNTTGLTWEVKTNTGLQNYIHRFTWYDTDTLTNGGNAGNVGDSSTCGGELSNCNTLAYASALNTLNDIGLCYYTDWRLPTREELRSLIHYGKEKGSKMIDTDYFPFTSPTDHWTSQTAIYADISGAMAWEVHFEGGHSEAHNKQSNYVAVRLVRGPSK